jgi:sulfate adenylyltransferase subunit 1 (EFTu-like GTPase family)
VQYVRPKSDEFHDYRGHSGRVAGDVLKPGDDVLVLPSEMTSRIEGIDYFDEEIGAMVCWMTNEPLRPRQNLAIKHTTRIWAGP